MPSLHGQHQLDDEGTRVSKGLKRPSELRLAPRRISAHLERVRALRLTRGPSPSCSHSRRAVPVPGGGCLRAPAQREAARLRHRAEVLEPSVKVEAARRLVRLGGQADGSGSGLK